MTQTIITADEGAEAHRLNIEIQGRLIEADRNFLLAGRALVRMQDRKLYLALDCDTFEDYLASIHVSLTNGYRWTRQARRCDKLAAAALLHPEILGHVAEQTGLDVGPGTVRALAERAVLGMGIAKSDKVLGRALDAPDPEEAREWLEKGATLREVDVEREVGRAKRGGSDDARYDYLVGVKRRGQALLAELPALAVGDILALVATIHDLLKEVAAWCAEYERERSHNGRHRPVSGDPDSGERGRQVLVPDARGGGDPAGEPGGAQESD